MKHFIGFIQNKWVTGDYEVRADRESFTPDWAATRVAPSAREVAEAELILPLERQGQNLLLAMADGKGGEASQVLRGCGINSDTLRAALVDVRGAQRVVDDDPEAKFRALERYCTDLTELARRGKLDPVIVSATAPKIARPRSRAGGQVAFTRREDHSVGAMTSSCWSVAVGRGSEGGHPDR